MRREIEMRGGVLFILEGLVLLSGDSGGVLVADGVVLASGGLGSGAAMSISTGGELVAVVVVVVVAMVGITRGPGTTIVAPLGQGAGWCQLGG